MSFQLPRLRDKRRFLAVALLLAMSAAALAQTRPEDTETWTPVPAVVTPGITSREAPSDALVLFDGKTLAAWVSADHPDAPARWTIAGDLLTVNKDAGNIQTRRSFTDYQLHLEWRIPAGVTGAGQERGNSGVFLASTGPGDAGYELQVLDSYGNKTYVNGQAGSLYKQSAPLVNACKPPGEWQSYDVIWTAPRFGADGALVSPAYATVLQNGVLIQNHVALKGQTLFVGKPFYRKHGPAPIKLQAHGDRSAPISYRNIWVREL
ncbi:MAG: DUF1080 domain-containing protein [Armatimonadota bacterium]|nr:DUF1080 domain-containing protein [Armatimonadota bacterium]